MDKVAGFTTKNKNNTSYPNCVLALKPEPHDKDNPVPAPPAAASDVESDVGSDATDETELYEPAELVSMKQPLLINQEE